MSGGAPVTRIQAEALARAERFGGDYVAGFAAWDPDDVAHVIAAAEGSNDGEDWLLVVALRDGRFGFVAAGCDFTGWDCRSQGWSVIADTLDELAKQIPEDALGRVMRVGKVVIA